MTAPRRLEQDLPALLADLYMAGTPDYRDDLVREIARTPQRSAWTFPERWLPMDIATQRVPTARFPMRALGVLALIGILIAAAAAAYVGSQPRLPDPFGPAANGVVSYQQDGTFYLFDPDSGRATAMDTDATGWLDPWFAPDGRSLVVAKEVGADRAQIGNV
jgi:hypothetical protein